MQRNAIEYRTH